jgi:hypothetical protein
MDKQKQYDSLVEIVARARLLAANSDNGVVIKLSESIKLSGTGSVLALGYSDVKFNSDSVKRYKELLEEIE